MIFENMMPQALTLIIATIVGSSSKYIETIDRKVVTTVKEMEANNVTNVNVTEDLTRPSEFQPTQNSSNGYVDFKSITDSVLLNESYNLSAHVEKDNNSEFQSTETLVNRIDNDHNNSFSGEILTNLSRNTDLKTIEDTDKDYILTDDTSLTTQATSLQRKVKQSKEILHPNIPYHVQSGAGRIHTLTLDRKRIALQHHLQLVPMEDEPLGAMMLKDQRYLISVLVPIGIGMIGAAMIVGTVFTLRYVARKRGPHSLLDNDTEVDGSITPCISSISTETTDKMFLLLGDDEI